MSGPHGVCSFVLYPMYNAPMKMPEQIETERLILRPLPVDDGSAIFSGWAQDKEVTRYLTWRPHKSLEQTAARAIIDWVFQQPFIYRVYATTDVENIASQRVLEKMGMQREGLLRKCIIHPNRSDVPRDSYICAIIKQ